MTSPYQLTSYPLGSKREFWTMSWPLMLAMISSSLMIFIDRLFLAKYHSIILNAAASGGIAYYIFLVLPMSIASISEVLTGRLHGEKRHKEIGSSVWQMVWFSIFLTPVFLLIIFTVPPILFKGTGIEMQETAYFKILMYFAPFQCITIALSGFFIGIGKVKVITISAILGNLVNISLDYILIFGWKSIPAFGIAGAAFATGFSQLIQTIFLLIMILKPTERSTYQTENCGFRRHFFIEGLKIGTPFGLGHMVEIMAHFLFFRIVMSVNQTQMTIVAMVQSFYILCSFINDAGSKAASAIVSNLLGAEVKSPIKKVLKSAFSLQCFYFLFFTSFFFLFPDFLINLFLSSKESSLLADDHMRHTFILALFFMTIFFLFDGFGWILIGFLTAAGDTKFIFWTSLFIHWIAYVAPTVVFIGIAKKGADTAWAIVAGMSVLNALIYLYRYQTGKWLKEYKKI